jgi:stage IV sporulation protein B
MARTSLGQISNSTVNGIRKSLPGLPGEKQATLSKTVIGTIEKNSNIGVFGRITDKSNFKDPVIEVASPSEVKLGKAEIWTVLNGDQKEKYTVEVVEVKNQLSKGIKGIKIHITDQDLLDKTGGIIQGMSGSPIIQNNKLIGAVSHVVIDSPDYGYGVYALWMINNF